MRVVWGLTGDGKSQKNDLRNVQHQSCEDGHLVPFHGPYIDTPEFLPRTERSEAGKRGETDDCIDLETGELGPLLTEDRPEDEGETVEKVAEACDGEERIDDSATMRTSSDDDGGYGRGRLH